MIDPAISTSHMNRWIKLKTKILSECRNKCVFLKKNFTRNQLQVLWAECQLQPSKHTQCAKYGDVDGQKE